jgi:hypothetical protein
MGLGYAHMRDETRDRSEHVGIFRYGVMFMDRTTAAGFVYSMGPAIHEDANFGGEWRLEALGRGRKRGVGGWETRIGFACLGTTNEGVCQPNTSRTGMQAEAYVETEAAMQAGISWITEYGSFREREWRHEGLAFVRVVR